MRNTGIEWGDDGGTQSTGLIWRPEGVQVVTESAEMTRGTGGDTEVDQQGLVHSALLYRSQREYVDFVARFVAEGLEIGEPVLVAVPREYQSGLRNALRQRRHGLPAELRMIDITEVARNPGRFMATQHSFAEEYPDRRVRIVSQLAWPGRTADESLACVQHEALVNRGLGARRVTGLCLYDANRLTEQDLAYARATHPLVWRRGSAHRSSEYAPDHVLEYCNQPLRANPGAVTYDVRKSTDLRPARSFAVDYAGWLGLSEGGVEDLQLIATELATNSLMYGNGSCRLAFWRDDDHLVCEARDTGRLKDPLVGRLHPGPSGPASRGLFLVNAISDLVRTHTTTSGTTIQAYLRFDHSRRPNS